MRELFQTINEYPWTTIFSFVALLCLLETTYDFIVTLVRTFTGKPK